MGKEAFAGSYQAGILAFISVCLEGTTTKKGRVSCLRTGRGAISPEWT